MEPVLRYALLAGDNMSKKDEEFDWVKAIYSLSQDKSTTMHGIIESAGLDPYSGDLTDIDLSNIDLSRQNLSGWDLRKANMSNTILKGTDLRGTNIDPCSLLNARCWKQARLDKDTRRRALLLEMIKNDVALPEPVNPFEDITNLQLPERITRVLRSHNIKCVGDLVHKTEAEMLRVPNLGRKGLNDVKQNLAEKGWHLGMLIPNSAGENNKTGPACADPDSTTQSSTES
jgi:hypothetical protein